MNKTILALALLVAGSAAQAQSNVTIYGKVDLGFRKAVASSAREISTSGDSRLGFKGTEDLGGGLKAFFGMENRFFADTGGLDGDTLFKGYAKVGLSGAFGSLGLGRQYIAAFSLVQNQVDPFGGDTVAQVRDVGMRVGGITKTRVNGSIAYDHAIGGLKFGATLAESDKNGGPNRPVSAAASYETGPWWMAAGFESPAGDKDRQWNIAAGYMLGNARLTAGYANGRTNADKAARGYALGLNYTLASGEFKAAYGTQKLAGVTTAQKLGLGYHHFLSKRTTIYADLGYDNKATSEKTGYDLGIRHSF